MNLPWETSDLGITKDENVTFNASIRLELSNFHLISTFPFQMVMYIVKIIYFVLLRKVL